MARPFRDAYGYFSGLADAKAENERLRDELRKANALAAANLATAQRAEELQKLMQFEEGTRYPNDYRAVHTTVIAYPTSAFAQQVTIAAARLGHSRRHAGDHRRRADRARDERVLAHGARHAPHRSRQQRARARRRQRRQRVDPARTGQHALLRPRLEGEEGLKGDLIVTQGTVDRRYPDIYPYGIPIGRVINVGTSDIASFLTVQVAPLARFDSLDAVAALVSTKKR